MRAFFAAILAIAAISIGAYYTLNEIGFSTAQGTTGPNVRLDE